MKRLYFFIFIDFYVIIKMFNKLIIYNKNYAYIYYGKLCLF